MGYHHGIPPPSLWLKRSQVPKRLVVDFRAVNEATITDGYPLPLINDILQAQRKFKICSVLDMKDGFHQVPLKKHTGT